MNHLEVLGLSIDDIEGQGEEAITKLVESAHLALYKKTLGGRGNIPRSDGLSNSEYQNRLNQAKKTLLDPEKRSVHLKELRQSQKKDEQLDADAEGVEVKTNPAVDATKGLSKVALVLSALIGFFVSIVLASNEIHLGGADSLPPMLFFLFIFVAWVAWKVGRSKYKHDVYKEEYSRYGSGSLYLYARAGDRRGVGKACATLLIGSVILLPLGAYFSHYLLLPFIAGIFTGLTVLVLWRHSVNRLTRDGLTHKTQALIVAKMLVPSMVVLGLVLSDVFVESSPTPATVKQSPRHGDNMVGTRPAPRSPSNAGNTSKPRLIPPSPKTVEDRLGLRRADRVLVQKGLTALKYAPGQADGKFGPKTRVTLERWQASKGYQSTGYLNRDQADELIAAGRNTGPITTSSYPPGRYQLAKDAPLLKEPRDNAAVVARLSSGRVVNITEATGDYLRVVSKKGRPPGYVHRRHVRPAR